MAEGKTARQLVCTMCPFDKAYVLLLFLLISLIGSRTARRSLCAAILWVFSAWLFFVRKFFVWNPNFGYSSSGISHLAHLAAN